MLMRNFVVALALVALILAVGALVSDFQKPTSCSVDVAQEFKIVLASCAKVEIYQQGGWWMENRSSQRVRVTGLFNGKETLWYLDPGERIALETAPRIGDGLWDGYYIHNEVGSPIGFLMMKPLFS